MSDGPTEYTQLSPPRWEVGEKIIVEGSIGTFTATITDVGPTDENGTFTATAVRFPDAPTFTGYSEEL